MRLAALIVLLATTTAVAEPQKPSDRARKVAQDQLAAFIKNDHEAMLATFAPGAVILGFTHPDTPIGKSDNNDFQVGLVGGNLHDVLKKASLTSVTAGGTDDVVWFTAEISVTVGSADPKIARLTEVMAVDGDSAKVAAAVFDHPAKARSYAASQGEIGGSTETGPLASLIASPAALAKALSKNPQTIVLGPDTGERAIGPAAGKRLIDKWSKWKLEVDGKVREVETKTFGFAQANVSYKKDKDTIRMRALVVALPDGNGWSVVAVHLTAI